MPAITVSLEEVERRVRQLRRRLNAVAVQHCIYLSASAALLVCAALLCLGLHASTITFRFAWWTGAAAVTATLAWCAFTLRTRWFDREAAGWLADRRANLGDRLTTLLALRRRPRTSSLTPVLLAQTLGLGERWQPKKLAPHRVPRSVFGMIASLAVFTLALFFAPETPPAPAAVPAPAHERASQDPEGTEEAGREDGSQANTTANEKEQGSPESESGTGRQRPGPNAGSARSASGDRPPPASGGALASLPDRVQNAIRHRFRAQATDRARGLGSVPRRANAGGDEGRSRTAAKDTPRKKGKDTRDAQKPSAARRQEGSKRKQESGSKFARREGKRQAGGRPGAGSGPMRGQAVGKGGTGDATARKEGTFKVTLNSFLDAVPQPRRRPGRADGKEGAAGQRTTGEERELSERQMGDEVLRKTLVPAEYEDVVRRIYVSRAQR
jgi:hypothetical protein